jgi:hypothetical protein
MNVNVFVMHVEGALQAEMLVLPLEPSAPVPEKYRTNWQYFATVDTSDKLFGGIDARAIEVEVASSGFAVVAPGEPRRT